VKLRWRNEKNPVKHVLWEKPTKKYTTFTAPYSENRRIEHTGYKGCLLGYAVSIAFPMFLIRGF
jgi:hypothetical protein